MGRKSAFALQIQNHVNHMAIRGLLVWLCLLILGWCLILSTEHGARMGIDSHQCKVFWNRGTWSKDLSRWEIWNVSGGQDDLRELRAFVGSAIGSGKREPDEQAEMDSIHVLFTGDSTMAHLVHNLPFNIMYPQYGSGNITKTASRCDIMEYFGLSRSPSWVPPDLKKMEGPNGYGLENPYCTDCIRCNAWTRVFGYDNLIKATYEYVPIEFAMDREFQTSSTATSQETLALYLSSLNYKHNLCIASAGLHDITLPNHTGHQFAVNVLTYISLVSSYCTKILWLLPPASLDMPPQTHKGLFMLTHSIMEVCDKLGPKVLAFNIWNMSWPERLHVDNVHHNQVYYYELGRLIFGL